MTTTKIDHQNGVLRICVDRLEGNRAGGRVFSQRLTAPMSFSDLGGLLLQLEAQLGRQNFPQAFQRMRSFTSEAPEYPAGLLPTGAMWAGTVAEAKGEKATFVVRILTRQNATWQGVLEWLERGQRNNFSSDLEFLKLLEQDLRQIVKEETQAK